MFFTAFMQSSSASPDLQALQRLFVRMRFSREGAIDPREYCETYGERHPNFQVYHPQDAVEYFQALVNELPETAARLFEGQTRTEFKTLRGQRLDVVDAVFVSLDLDVTLNRTLPDSIRHLCERETLRGDNRFFDSRSGLRVDAVFSVRFIQAPPILVCHLRRFDFDTRTHQRQKIDDRFEFGLELTLPHVDAQYALSGVVLHCGSAEDGHYRALVQDAGQWVQIDDTHVVVVPEESVLAQSVGGFAHGWNAYLLFYTRTDLLKVIVHPGDVPAALRLTAAREADEFTGLASSAAAEFLAKIPSPAVRFQYFLGVLCRSQQPELALSFSDKVIGLPREYEAHFKDIVWVVHEREELADMMLRLLLTGVSDGLLEQVEDVADLIAQKRYTVEWFGCFLVRCGQPCPGAMAVLSVLADRYPERGDDLSGYVRLVETSDSRLHPLFAKNDALLDAMIAVRLNEGMSWTALREFCNGRKSNMELALTCLRVYDIPQLPFEVEQICGNTEFLLFIQKTRDLTDSKLVMLLARHADLIFFPGLAHQSKSIRKQTLGFVRLIFRNQNGESATVCLFRLINQIGKLEQLPPAEVGRYVHYFKAMHWLAQLANKKVEAFRAVLLRAQPKLVSAHAPFNRDMLEFSRLLIEGFPLRTDDYSKLFLAFFWNPADFTGAQLRKALAVFFSNLKKAPLTELSTIFESNEFRLLVRRAIAVGTREAAQFVAFVRSLAEQSETHTAQFIAGLQ
jgi:hypothetical protein